MSAPQPSHPAPPRPLSTTPPALPTPLASPQFVDPGTVPATGESGVRWRRAVATGDVDAVAATDPTAGVGADTASDEPPDPDAPTGWRPTAGAIGALRPEDGDGRLLVGAGAGTERDWRAVGAAAVTAPGSAPGAPAVLLGPDTDADHPDDAVGWAAVATGVVLGSYRFSLRSTPARPVPAVRLAVPAEHRDAVARAVVLARATALARDLAEAPSDTKSPAWFAATAADLVAGSGLRTTVRDEEWLTRHGFGGMLAVGGGSARPPRLLELAWTPPGATGGPHVVLVGKGITFDTGGISIKTTAGMVDMRTDCAGGAAVVGALRAVAELNGPVRVTGLVPLAENHVSGSAYRPGDVVRHHDGTTSEVTNTDAEGRMVLADALGWAVATLQPDVLIDVATLTGAMKTALGTRTGGVFATDPELAARVVAAGARIGEAWWPMPLHAAHVPDVDGTLADVRQAPTGPGAIMAALFLHRFRGDRPWVHLDIAGPARSDRAHEEVTRGATGFAARTLAELCLTAGRAEHDDRDPPEPGPPGGGGRV